MCIRDRRKDVATFAQTEVVPELFRHVHTERGRALIAVCLLYTSQRQYVRLPWTLPRTEQGRTEGLDRLPIERG